MRRLLRNEAENEATPLICMQMEVTLQGFKQVIETARRILGFY